MARRILVTSTDLMMKQFLIPHIVMLSENGFEVEIACSDIGGRLHEIQEKLRGYVKKFYTIRLVRSPFTIKNIYGYRDLKEIIKKGNYDLIWTNEPVMGVSTRLAAIKARKTGTKVIYMAHGFHFFKGAPLINWLLYYPVEKLCSRWTDVLITINKEDYERAKKKMKARKIEYVPGVGFNLDRFGGQKHQAELVKRMELRQSIGVGKNAVLFLSAGELNGNKNHSVMIKALGELQKNNEEMDLQYAIAGKGELEADLKQLAKKCGVADRVHFLGYRNDVADWYQAADVFVHPSKREGLPVSLMEAMVSGLPCVVSRIRGNVDLVDEGKGGFCFESKKTSDLIFAIDKIMACNRKKMADYNVKKVQHYGLQAVSHRMEEIYMSIGLC